MLIQKNIAEYIVYVNETVHKALEKINANKKRIVFVISEEGILCGSLSDGDFRRWVTAVEKIDLSIEVGDVFNRKVKRVSVNSSKQDIERCFVDGVDAVPLVDENGRLVAIATNKISGIQIGDNVIDEDTPAFIIAEIGNNHNGDIALAKKLVDLAHDAGADCVKFQMRDLSSLYKNGSEIDVAADLGAQYTLDLLKKFQLEASELIEVFNYCKVKGLTPLCTPWDLESLKVLESYGMKAYKVASADFTNHELLDALASTGKPLICSTGMCSESEIRQSIRLLKSRGVTFVLLHCNSTYPTPFKDVNLSYLPRLAELAGGLVGYSGHERGIQVPIAAVALGAKVVEKHFTIDKNMEGNDHKVSLLPDEFKLMVSMIRDVEEAMGSSESRSISQGEMINRETLAKSLVVNCKIDEGVKIERTMIEVKSPGQGLQPMYLNNLVGKVSKRSMRAGDYFYESDLYDNVIEPRNYHFNRPFGIPVRYHDYRSLSCRSNFEFVEFHLSYHDLDLDLNEFFVSQQEIGFAVHSPELFEGDHILDLAADSRSYRDHSVSELNKVCEITRNLKYFFPKTDCPLVVVNAGGFTRSSFIEKSERANLYKRVGYSLSQIDCDGLEIIIQTMPPFPWHFGGQCFHNLFMDPDEIKSFYEEFGYRICYDVSHSMMACNYFNWDLDSFTRKIGPLIAHIHIVDALGVDGEGVQIGKGSVDFERLAFELDRVAPGVQFIPEVWQGHKNNGEGFWSALEFLEGYFGGY